MSKPLPELTVTGRPDAAGITSLARRLLAFVDNTPAPEPFSGGRPIDLVDDMAMLGARITDLETEIPDYDRRYQVARQDILRAFLTTLLQAK